MTRRTTLILPDGLLEKVLYASGKATKTEAVAEALTAYVTRKGIDRLIAARGKFPNLRNVRRERRAADLRRERTLDRLRRR